VEHKDGVIFLHAVKDGPANQSYGLQVAALAGVPAKVVKRAREKLVMLERQAHRDSSGRAAVRQMDLFELPAPSAALDLLKTITPEEISPRAALEWLYRLKALQEE
jgi:DNA mismatch repair protein MutS